MVLSDYTPRIIDFNSTNQYMIDNIKDILKKFILPDGSSILSRLSDIKETRDKVVLIVDISGIRKQEGDKIRSKVIEKLNSNEKRDIDILLTSNKGSSLKNDISGVKKIIVIASGKGGVGKSTISALLAHNLFLKGNKVGILDGDIYGPSIPCIFDISERSQIRDNKILPHSKYGIDIVSAGFLITEGNSISLRGPMASKLLYQLLSLTLWKDLDYLIIDTPPGTGDLHLSLLQNYNIDDVIIITTPQKISRSDVMRTIDLYKKFNIPITGIIENMSHIALNQHQIQIFPGDSGQYLADKYQIPLLAQIPINSDLSYDSDNGKNLKQYAKLLNNIY